MRFLTGGQEGVLINPTSWKGNSRKFAVASDSSTRLQPLDNRLSCSPLGSKHADLVAVVAPLCIKELRLVTMQLPEKFSPIGVGTNRSSHIRVSRKFASEAKPQGLSYQPKSVFRRS
jgi:hypothetical protein